MIKKNNIIWLASYPKSGNTWFRLFLTALNKDKKSFNINETEIDGFFSSKDIIQEVLDIEPDLLYPNEIKIFQNLSWTYLSKNSKKTQFIKIHDAFELYDQNAKLSQVPNKKDLRAIYFVRNPLDIVPSLSNHLGFSLQQSVNFINHTDSKIGNNNSFSQHLGTWNEHVKSWLNHPIFPVYFLRYEDMKTNTFDTFKKAVKFMKLKYTDREIRKAITITSFKNLRKQEEEMGFKEIPTKFGFFFNKGEMNYGEKLLLKEQIDSIKKVNEEMMKHFGYWH